MYVQDYDDVSDPRVTTSWSKAGQYLDNSIMGLLTNTTLNSEEYEPTVKFPHEVVQCRSLDLLDSGVQLHATYNER